MKTLINTLGTIAIISAISIIPVGIYAIAKPTYATLFWFTLNALVLALSYLFFLLSFALRHHDIWIFKRIEY